MKTFEEIEKEIQENLSYGYETAIVCVNGRAVKYGSLISDLSELPDVPENCDLIIWNNENIDFILSDYIL